MGRFLIVVAIIGALVFFAVRRFYGSTTANIEFKKDIAAVIHRVKKKKKPLKLKKDIVIAASRHGIQLKPEDVTVVFSKDYTAKLGTISIHKRDLSVSFPYSIRGIVFMQDKQYSLKKSIRLKSEVERTRQPESSVDW